MAFTVSSTAKTVFGNKRVLDFRVTADAATQTISTGLSTVESATLTPESMTTAAAKLRLNQDVSGTVANGSVAVTGVASGDVFFLKIYGN
jgi:hypothetical protein